MAQVLDPLQTARLAVGRHAWRDAYDDYSQVERKQLTPGDLERFGEAAWWSGKLEEAIGLRERAYTGYSTAGEKLNAARIALTLSWDHGGRGEFAVSNGWFANAQRLLEGEEESSEHAFALLARGVDALYYRGNIAEGIEIFDQTLEVARRLKDRDVEVLALVGKGRAKIKAGDAEEGLALMDEGATSAVCGELRPYSTGLVYCMTISACHDLGDYRRAAEWTEAANRWCDREDVTGFPGACRIHRAEIMRLRGDLVEAEKQAVAACEELGDFERSITAGGYYEVGEIRRRLGDFAAAELAYQQANELGRDPQPGVALLRLAQGKVDAAAAGISRSLGEVEDPLSRMRRLPAQVEIAVASGDLNTGRTALEELERIVDSYKIGGKRAPAFDAAIHYASGQIKLAENDLDGALRCLKRARDEWQRVGAPYEIAQSRMLLGVAFRRLGDEHAAATELEAALATFERLNAKLDTERVKELLGRVETRRTFLFTDIVDSTKLLETLGDEKWRRLLARHDELLREHIGESGGEVIKQTGDGFFAAFDNPKAAIEAAVAIQRALDAEIVAPDVRIGAHTGAAFRTDAKDYGGQGVHAAARIGAQARAGEILVSRETLDGFATAFHLSEPRTAELAGVEAPIDVVSVDWR